RPARIVLVGGQSAVSDAVGRSIAHRHVDRVAGKDRYATAAALAGQVPSRSSVALIASGTSFPDALSAGPSASALGGTFALTGRQCLPTASAQGMTDDGVREVLIIGGESAVPDAAADPCEPVVPATTTTIAPRPTTTTTTTVPRPGGGTTTTVPRSTTTTTAPPADAPVPKLTARGSLPEDAADPAILKVGNRWYAYATQVYLTKVPMRWSDDLRTWSRSAEAMPGLAPWAEFGAHWAPSVTQVGGRFVMWYSARDRTSGRQCISRAVADRPEGPFVDELRAAPVCQVALGGSIDPHVFTDQDGSRWLSWKSDENSVGVRSQLWTAPLSIDARTLTGAPVAVLAQDAAWETFTIEQPALYRKGDVYYLFYSGGYWESDTYAIGYATGSSPRGPFTKQTVAGPWLATAAGAAGPGALDVFSGPGSETWVTYHAWTGGVGYVNGAKRTLRVAKLDL
ncbi:MAG: beta-xylosidase, partial [Actinomycetia bacterium]|nr:beta-xylosidase [Actinomycetes bacterium]